MDETSQNRGGTGQKVTGETRETDEMCGTRRAKESSGGETGLKRGTDGQSAMGNDGGSCSQKKSKFKRNFFWCPVTDCASGPVQKVTQHLQKVHKMDPATASNVARKKRRAPAEAIRLKIPNPKTRSSGLQHLGLFAKNTDSPGISSPGLFTSSTPKQPPPVPPNTPITLGLGGQFHTGGSFLDGLCSHLKTRSGGKRGEQSATQITRYVGK